MQEVYLLNDISREDREIQSVVYQNKEDAKNEFDSRVEVLDLLSEYMEEIKWREVEITSVGWEKYEWEIRKFIVEYIDEYNDEEEKSYIWVGKLISKKFWFIKWLVENEKIDLDKLEKKVLKENLIRKFDEWLLMLLSIQDEPIEFLVSILK